MSAGLDSFVCFETQMCKYFHVVLMLMTAKYENCAYLENTGHLLRHHAQQPDFVLTLRLLSMGLGFYTLFFQFLVHQKSPLGRKHKFTLLDTISLNSFAKYLSSKAANRSLAADWEAITLSIRT